jgi:hypothetical protein
MVAAIKMRHPIELKGSDRPFRSQKENRLVTLCVHGDQIMGLRVQDSISGEY